MKYRDNEGIYTHAIQQDRSGRREKLVKSLELAIGCFNRYGNLFNLGHSFCFSNSIQSNFELLYDVFFLCCLRLFGDVFLVSFQCFSLFDEILPGISLFRCTVSRLSCFHVIICSFLSCSAFYSLHSFHHPLLILFILPLPEIALSLSNSNEII